MVSFAQCAYGLQFPDSSPHEFCLKRTCILSNMLELAALHTKCPGISDLHAHVHAQGSFRWEGKLLQRAACA
eukprot:12111756-Heterocapsa_arctica.AAC.1